MKSFFKLLLNGFLAFIIWTIAAFIGYSFTGTGDRPTLIGSVVILILVFPATFYLGKYFNRGGEQRPIVYGIFTALMVFALNLLISIPNGTTKVFFGNWFVFITFLGIFVGGYFGSSKKRN